MAPSPTVAALLQRPTCSTVTCQVAPGTVAQVLQPPLLEASVPLVRPYPGKPLGNHRSNVAGEPGHSLGFFKQYLTLKDQKESVGQLHNKWLRIPPDPSSELRGCERPSQNPRRMEIG